MDDRKTYIGIVLYLDEEEERFRYPNISKGALRRGEVYYRDLAVCFASISRHAKDAGDIRYLLFINKRPTDARLGRLLSDIGVESVFLDYGRKPPPGYCSSWQGTFYYIDALEYLNGVMGEEDAAILLDPDCVCLSSISPVIEAVRSDGSLNYQIDYDADYDVNGFTRRELRKIIFEEDGLSMEPFPNYYGGEIYGISGRNITRLYRDADEAWKTSLNRFKLGLTKFNTEEHLFSYVLWKTGLGRGNANRYLKRIWTSPYYRNVEHSDTGLLIWHLPYEKERALLRLSDDALDMNSRFWSAGPGEFMRYVGAYTGIPRRTFPRYLKDAVYGGLQRVLKPVRG